MRSDACMVVWNSLWMRKLMGKLGKTRRRKDKNLRARILGLPQLELFQEHLLGGTNEDVEVKQWLWVQRTLWREKWWEMRAISLWRASVVKSISLTGSVWYGIMVWYGRYQVRSRGREAAEIGLLIFDILSACYVSGHLGRPTTTSFSGYNPIHHPFHYFFNINFDVWHIFFSVII